MTTLADVDEAEALRNTQDAMSIVGLSAVEQVGLSCSSAQRQLTAAWCSASVHEQNHSTRLSRADPTIYMVINRFRQCMWLIRAVVLVVAASLHLGNIELKSETCLEGTCQQPPCTGHVQEAVLSVVAAVLHLGNVELAQNAEDEAVLASDAAEEELRIVAGLLQVGVHQCNSQFSVLGIRVWRRRRSCALWPACCRCCLPPLDKAPLAVADTLFCRVGPQFVCTIVPRAASRQQLELLPAHGA